MKAISGYCDAIRHNVTLFPDKLAIRDLTTGRELTFAELDSRIERLASFLQDRGIGMGDRVALLAQNGSEFFEILHACSRLGAISVFLNTRLTSTELSYIASDCQPKLLVYDRVVSDTARELLDQCNIPYHLEIVAGDPSSSYETTLATMSGRAIDAHVTHDDPCFLMYTSGTTGHPKGAIITHGMLFWNLVNVNYPCRISRDAVQLVLLPFFHIGGLNCHALPILTAGGTVLLCKTFDAGEALRIVNDRSFGVTHINGVPSQFQMMVRHEAFTRTDFSSLRFVGMGGSPCPASVIDTMLARGVPLSEGFGMTEASPLCATLNFENVQRKRGSIGKALMWTNLRIVDPETRLDVDQGCVGELWIRGPNVTPGYWRNPAATDRAFCDGWFRTGDAARKDEEGFLYIVDRVKDMYISGGENVYPAEVERVILLHEGVADAAVIGIPDEKWGESGLAVVVPKLSADLDAMSIQRHCRARLGKFKVPVRIEFLDNLPRNASGKVLKRQLREMFAVALSG
ncbi:acyl-CoA synthetase [Bradyrhizobium sp. DASA03007]|uniref:acyl-CoA synthetase n=1 Tax=unclassified Bradyrhizobium TaxID=2631580 RepID=UPI003F6ED904